jgi:glycosyltransferase involved in cell wall biosynthesis
LIICDNASTDATRQICREYASRDPARVSYHRSPTNLGPAENFNRCFRLARGEYFKWAAHDDVCLPTYLERCVAVLDADRAVVNCHTRTRVIDESGRPVRDYDLLLGTDAPQPHVRFARFINVSHRRHVGYEIFGVMRRDVVARVPPQGAYAHADRIFLTRLCLRGRFCEIDEPLFLARRHASQSMAYHERRDLRAWLARYLGAGPLPPPEWWDASQAGRIVFPDWNLLRAYYASVRDAPLSAAERAHCRVAIARWLLKYWPKLARDVVFAGERLLTRSRPPEAATAGAPLPDDEDDAAPAAVERPV